MLAAKLADCLDRKTDELRAIFANRVEHNQLRCLFGGCVRRQRSEKPQRCRCRIRLAGGESTRGQEDVTRLHWSSPNRVVRHELWPGCLAPASRTTARACRPTRDVPAIVSTNGPPQTPQDDNQGDAMTILIRRRQLLVA